MANRSQTVSRWPWSWRRSSPRAKLTPVPAAACSDFTGTACGDAAGDSLCAPEEDCIADNAGDTCECRPRVCCKCETEPGTT